MSAKTTVADAGERRIIQMVRSLLPDPPPWVVVGLGDDAAVVEGPRNQLDVVTTDVIVEGVHFDRRFGDAASIGHKALAVNLSDLAAMGALPRAALLSLGLPGALPLDELEALVGGFASLARRERVAVIGGNVSRSPGPIFVDVTAFGAAKRRKILTRSGAGAGDELFLSGTIGAAAAGLAWLSEPGPDSLDTADAVSRFLRPEPRVRLGVLVGRTGAASACIDLSDGLADAVRQLADASGVGATVDAEALPIHPAAAQIFTGSEAAVRAALSGGEDYELLFAVPKRSRRRFEAAARMARAPAVRIGEITENPDVLLRMSEQTISMPLGFEHFRT